MLHANYKIPFSPRLKYTFNHRIVLSVSKWKNLVLKSIYKVVWEFVKNDPSNTLNVSYDINESFIAEASSITLCTCSERYNHLNNSSVNLLYNLPEWFLHCENKGLRSIHTVLRSGNANANATTPIHFTAVALSLMLALCMNRIIQMQMFHSKSNANALCANALCERAITNPFFLYY